ncbi:diguanylate cyclase domain-containing protein, partial [Aeromonas salmonicida]|uniref:diguanylate cyclase domain-containing protein n=1 Tax=Aeromonas salmonicida TaxID=645 RepID=UPI001C5D39B7
RVGELLTAEPGTGAVYRSGGDELAALLPWERHERESRLHHLLARVRNQQWLEFKTPVTLSAGGAHYPEDGLFMFERADECLYQSKRPGRDRWHRSPSPDTGGEPVSPGVTISV